MESNPLKVEFVNREGLFHTLTRIHIFICRVGKLFIGRDQTAPNRIDQSETEHAEHMMLMMDCTYFVRAFSIQNP